MPTDTNPIRPIGIIHTEFKTLHDMPIQPAGASSVTGTIVINPELQPGLTDLDGFSHIYLIYQFHQSSGYDLMPTPFLDIHPHGVFATRAPRRPNPIGLSIVRLLSVRDNELTIQGADILDGTPLLDIKPYVDQFDRVKEPRSGWVSASEQAVEQKKSDHRFSSKNSPA
ncbi:MAG: tRNA (N6-threonylcarbamoyladenosine(37)-N6)-methyltransferase TrmO [Candidatus Sedimenticola endophacoides]